MDSSPSSRFQVLAENGDRLDAPVEWTPCLLSIDYDLADWQRLELLRNGKPLQLYVTKLGGGTQILADWGLMGAGSYELELTNGSWRETRTFFVSPQKLTDDGYRRLLDDLQRRLPATIAIALQQSGALAGIHLVAPQETTLAEELNRIRRACLGTSTRRGLIALLVALANVPHQVLQTIDVWSPRERARRINPVRLYQAFTRPANLDMDKLPLQVPEQRVQHSVDVYENRLLRAFVDQVELRLRRVVLAAEQDSNSPLHREASDLLKELTKSRRSAEFLDEVSELIEPPTRLTMVLLKRSEYRAALEGFLEFRRSALVRLDEPALNVPLENLPYLYETWGTLQVISALLEVAGQQGFRVRSQQLVHRRPNEVWIRILRDGEPALEIDDPRTGQVIKLIPQKTYGVNAEGLHSISFGQRPDIAIEISDARGMTDVWIFDPKYKLESEQAVAEEPFGRPKKEDIDAMHAYRDALRDSSGSRVVKYAAILYPGESKSYTDGLEAIRAVPTATEPLGAHLRRVLTGASRSRAPIADAA